MAVLLTTVGMATALLVGVLVGIGVGRRSRSAGAAAPAPSQSARSGDDFALIERHRDGFVVADERGRIVYRNAVARQLIGTHIGVLVDDAIDRHISVALREGRSHEVLEMYGPPKVVLVVEALALDAGGAVVYIEDVSERRRIDQVRTDFVANISHELRTPVGALSVLAETLEDEDDPETVRRVVDRMMSEAQRASRTIDDLIELSRIELGGERDIEPVRIDGVLVEAMDRVKELATHGDIAISELAGADKIAGVVVEGDRRQLVSAVGNLVENAVKYSEPGGSVQVCTRIADERVEIAVVDQGVGIPQRDLDRIFERFYRVDRARSRATGGTGLGLSIVRHVAQKHGGDVDVVSAEGEGSTFTLRLPARRARSGDGTGAGAAATGASFDDASTDAADDEEQSDRQPRAEGAASADQPTDRGNA